MAPRAENGNNVFPWDEPPLNDWYIVCLNHRPVFRPIKTKYIFCAMTRGLYVIEAYGESAEDVFAELRRKALALHHRMGV